MFGDDGIRVAIEAEGGQISIESFCSMETPGVAGERLDELDLECGAGFAIGVEACGEAVIFGETCAGHDDGLPGDSSPASVMRPVDFCAYSRLIAARPVVSGMSASSN